MVQKKGKLVYMNKAGNGNRRLLLSFDQRIEIIETSTILRVTYLKKACRISFADGSSLVIPKSLQWFEEQLTQQHFVRVNRKEIVNLSFIDRYEEAEPPVIWLTNGECLEVIKGKRNTIAQFEMFKQDPEQPAE